MSPDQSLHKTCSSPAPYGARNPIDLGVAGLCVALSAFVFLQSIVAPAQQIPTESEADAHLDACGDGGEQENLSNPTPNLKPPAKRLEAKGIENLHRLSLRFLSGGQPEGEVAFDELKKLGVKTVISVDGIPPDLEMAHNRGIRYVHLPIGYDGLKKDRLPQLLKAARELPGPIFIHCHHGKHRGPAAAAACMLAAENWTAEQAIAWLAQAGTDRGYRGLYRDVQELVIPSIEETMRLEPDFPESVPASTLVEAMLEIDERHDRLKAFAQRNWKQSADERKAPVETVVELLEAYRELGRSAVVRTQHESFATFINDGERQLKLLQEDLESADGTSATKLLQSVSKNCKECHTRFRDMPTGNVE